MAVIKDAEALQKLYQDTGLDNNGNELLIWNGYNDIEKVCIEEFHGPFNESFILGKCLDGCRGYSNDLEN